MTKAPTVLLQLRDSTVSSSCETPHVNPLRRLEHKMNNQADLRFDIDALFAHMANIADEDEDQEQEKDWHFAFRSTEISKLEDAAEELKADFAVQVQESVEEVDIDGNISYGDPLLLALVRGNLALEEVKEIAARMKKLAEDHDLIYEGVDCYDAIDAEELYGWLAPEDAGWRLRHMTDCGLEENADLPWVFLVDAPNIDSVSTISAALEANGFDDREDYDEPNDEGEYGVCVFVHGRNNESELYECASKITDASSPHGGTLIGIQFYDREDFAEIFGPDEE